MAASGAAQFTGERPGWGRDFDYDEARHLAAYRYATALVPGKHVADVGCGEGFGTQLLADTAASVLGLDYSTAAISVCRRTWHKPNLRFREADLNSDQTVGATFDLVLAFQVLEHIREEVAFLRRLKTLLAPGGTLLLTTPNRLQSFSENPYHVREYTAPELRAVLERVFSRVIVLGMFGNDVVAAFDRRRAQAVRRILRLDPLGLRKLLPAALVNFAFAKLAVLVRRQARDSASARRIQPDDFAVAADNLDAALDLVAHCEA